MTQPNSQLSPSDASGRQTPSGEVREAVANAIYPIAEMDWSTALEAADAILALMPTRDEAAPVSQGKAVEGWVVVPKEPTPEMQTSGVQLYEDAGGRGYSRLAICDGVYRAMIAAAPAKPGTEGEG